MATLLHVQATTRAAESYSLRTAQAFLDRYVTSHAGDTVETLDVWGGGMPAFGPAEVSAKYQILHGQPHTPSQAEAWKAVEHTIAQLTRADKLVVSTPMWNFGIPYALKQYLDVVVQPGYTFSYSEAEGYKGLMTGRRAMLILARGGAYAPGTEGAALDFQQRYLETLLGFIGFEDTRSIVVEPTLQGGPEAAAQVLAEAIKRACQEAAIF